MNKPNSAVGRLQKYLRDEPPDLISLLKKMFSSKQDIWQSNAKKEHKFQWNAGRFLWIALIVIVVIWALSGIYLVAPAEQAVVLRFGRYVKTVDSGPHWVAPFIEKEITLNVQQISNFNYSAEMLTKDENIVSVALAVQYRIQSPEDLLFNVVNPVNALQQATSSALRQVVGQMTLDAVLTTGREELRKHVSEQLNKTLKIYNTGLMITDVVLQPVKPPQAVIHAFDDAIKAREDEQTSINQSEAYNRQELAKVKGSIARITQQADAYKQQVVLQSTGDTARYMALLTPYQQSPVVTRERLYLDTVSQVLSRTTNIVVDNGGSNVLYLPIDKIIREQRVSAANKSSALRDDISSVNQPPGSSGNSSINNTNSADSFSYPGRPGYTGETR